MSAMTNAAFVELLAAFEAALGAAERNLKIARALADGCRSSLRPPEEIVDAYLACVERDERLLRELTQRAERFKTHA
jgi:hypothetical protein